VLAIHFLRKYTEKFILGSFIFRFGRCVGGIKLRLSLSEDRLTPLPAAMKAGLVEA
jgi:hypothetical protein